MATSPERVVLGTAAVGRAIRARRESLGLTQEELAVRAITNRYAIIKLEEGAATRAVRTLFDTLYALDLELVVRPRRHGRTR